ncbi:hypothetical protein [Brevibacterium sp. 'Marine']|uniref:hypothetical protein n=1 Tax=Brevibacterium sp. 'Marine' TaxID=2725563 RepID=UPI00145DCE61|nr:hypothetical protein [Brevibacterium sp. 'Marine']
MTGPPPDTPSFGEPESGPDEQLRCQLAEAVNDRRMSVNDIWLHYFSIGGSVGEYELEAYINSSYAISSLQRDILAQAVNELIDAQSDPPRAPYSGDSHVQSDDHQSREGHDEKPLSEPIDDDPGADEY